MTCPGSAGRGKGASVRTAAEYSRIDPRRSKPARDRGAGCSGGRFRSMQRRVVTLPRKGPLGSKKVLFYPEFPERKADESVVCALERGSRRSQNRKRDRRHV